VISQRTCFPITAATCCSTLSAIWKRTRGRLVFIDFRSGAMLHIIGTAGSVLDVPETARSAGIERLIFLDIQCVFEA